ncbi:response regulator [Roseomonas sp. 18066]|uniref:response regulator n=1 Tax=Roseomonas sp. 18066 TaxID=2681412 RepID=UPI00135A662E|nr:response regulator [Roseomonas sp. 18066]
MSQGMATSGKTRLLIVDDSMFMRMAISAMCELRDDIEVVGEAENGDEGVAMAGELAPDVITMDLDMPKMDGITATRLITEQRRVPIIILSSLSERGSELTFRALNAGASDFVCKSASALDVDLSTIAETLVEKIQHWGKQARLQAAPASSGTAALGLQQHDLAFAMAGEGGPQALSTLLQGIQRLRMPMLVAPDLPPPMFGPFLRFLETRIALPIFAAEDGTALGHDRVAVLPPGQVARLHFAGGGPPTLQVTAQPGPAGTPLATLLDSPGLGERKLLVMALSALHADTTAAGRLRALGHTLVAQHPEHCIARGAGDELLQSGLVTAGMGLEDIKHLVMEGQADG